MNYYFFLTILLFLTSSCDYRKDSSKLDIWKDSSNTYYVKKGKQISGTYISVALDKDHQKIEGIQIGCKHIPEQLNRQINNNNLFFPISNDLQLVFIDQLFNKLENEYALDSIRQIEIFTKCLGDVAIQLVEELKNNKNHQEVVNKNSFVRSIKGIIKKHGLQVKDIGIFEIYVEPSDNIAQWCTISNENKHKPYVDATIIFSFKEEKEFLNSK